MLGLQLQAYALFGQLQVACKHDSIRAVNPSGPSAKVSKQGGHARALALSPARRREIAREAAIARWNGRQGKKRAKRR